jgi:hypothetical protein
MFISVLYMFRATSCSSSGEFFTPAGICQTKVTAITRPQREERCETRIYQALTRFTPPEPRLPLELQSILTLYSPTGVVVTEACLSTHPHADYISLILSVLEEEKT